MSETNILQYQGFLWSVSGRQGRVMAADDCVLGFLCIIYNIINKPSLGILDFMFNL